MNRLTFSSPYPKQKEFLLSRARYIAYGGARGGGKSYVARMKAELLCLRYDGIQVLFMRRTYPELKENHLLPAMRELNGVAKYNGTDKAFIFPNGARLKFGYCRHDSDLLQYQGQAYDVIFLEECTQFPENVFTTMTESNRSSGLMAEHFPPRMYFTCNPGGVGHAWFKRLFIDREYKKTEKPEHYVFIQANVYDHKALMHNSPDYVNALENLPEDRKRAMLYGDWDVFEGQYFPEFRRETHVCEAFPIPDHWTRYKALDYGFDMLAVGWFAVDEHGTAYLYKEYCEGKDLGEGHDGLILSDAANAILERSDEVERDAITFAPPDLWNRRQDTGRSAADRFAECGVFMEKAKNDRVLGWLDLKEYLKVRKDTGKPSLMIFSNCTQTIKSLPMLLHDEKHPDDVANDPHEYTHPADMLRYFVAGRPIAASEPKEFNELTTEEEMGNVFSY